MNNSMVAHLWAHEQEESASGSNFFFEGTSIYSYGHHFEVGRIVKNKQGKKAYLINEDYYSVTTSKHQCYVRNAIPTWAMVFSVGDNISDTGNMRFVASKLESIKKSIEKYKRAKTELSYTDIWGAFGNMMDYIQFIGLKHRYMSFAISLTEHDIIQLLDDDSREESGSGTYYERECDALFDIDGRGNTERLVTRNAKLRNLLEDGEYIPSLGQLNLMAHYMDELNKAFTYVSASPLSSTWYWSSTESSQAVAWYVVFSSGLTGTGNKHIGDMVRAVIDF